MEETVSDLANAEEGFKRETPFPLREDELKHHE
jgi:hypothetical protein